MSEEESLLTFPCEFPIKIMGKNHHGFHKAVIEILKNHLTDFDDTLFRETESKQNWLMQLVKHIWMGFITT